MKSFNPRVNYREKEIVPHEIFESSTKDWLKRPSVDEIIESFFDGIKLDTIIYDYSFELIERYRAEGYRIACLTDLPSGMPDYTFKKPLDKLIERLDLYVSSQSCGYRKPNKYGLEYIADYFNADAEDILFIGDEEKDKAAAENFGCKFSYIDSVVYDTKPQRENKLSGNCVWLYIAYPLSLLFAILISYGVMMLNIAIGSIAIIPLSALIYIFAGGFILSKINDNKSKKLSLIFTVLCIIAAWIYFAYSIIGYSDSTVWLAMIAFPLSFPLASMFSEDMTSPIFLIISLFGFLLPIPLSLAGSLLFKRIKAKKNSKSAKY